MNLDGWNLTPSYIVTLVNDPIGLKYILIQNLVLDDGKITILHAKT